MKKSFKKYLLVMLMFSIVLIPFSRIFAKDKIIEDLEKGETIDVNVVDPVNLTKTLNYFKDEYIKSRPNDTETANSYFTPEGYAGEILTAYVSSRIKEQDVLAYVYDCDKNYTCKVSITYFDGLLGHVTEKKEYNAKFNMIGKYDSKIEDEMLETYKKINSMSGQGKFILEDMYMVDFLYNISKDNYAMTYLLSYAVNFTEGIKEINNKNYNFYATNNMGNAIPCMIGFGGGLMFEDKNSSVYFSSPSSEPVSFGMSYNYIIYIDETTPDTKEDYIRAAEKRINDYYGKDVVDIKYKESLKDTVEKDCNYQCNYEDYAQDEYGYGKLNMLPNMYTLTINNKEYDFLIVKDNKKLTYPTGVETVDYTTNIAIETPSNSNVPLDSKIEISLYDKDSKEFSKIEDTHKEYKFYDVFDIKLYSQTAEKYISKLDSGYFRVKLPYKKEYDGKKLVAYYFNENGKEEKYKVTKKDNYIYFDTKHFSVYSIGEENSLDNTPKTGIRDYSLLALIITLISLCGMVKLRKN